jgi:beta-glucosidase
MPPTITRRAALRQVGLGTATLLSGGVLARCAAPATQTSAPTAAVAPAAPSAAPLQPATSAPAPANRFPTGFLWGAATSAYQIEGAAKADGRGESVWDRFSHTAGKTRNGDTGDVACDHYHRYEQDLDLLRELGIQSYRFSIAWPRVLPSGAGAVNQKGLDFYKRLADGLNKRGIRAMATLFHWDLPQALQDQGGWENRDVAERFGEYADVVFRALGDTIAGWLTFNEPKTVLNVGYIYGAHAPGLQDPRKGYRALHHMLLGHGRAVQAFRALGKQPGHQIGIPLNLAPVYPAPGAPEDKDAVRLQDGFENRLFLDPVLRGSYPDDMLKALQPFDFERAIQPDDMKTIGQPLDILGVTYYNPTYVRSGPQVVSGPNPHSDASWQEIYPDGMYDILTRVKRDYGDIPITITENGRPNKDTLGANGQVDDEARETFLRDHFAATKRAIDAGVNVQSYHVWSLMDNFEWAEGYGQRWGVVYVDFKSQQRVPKRSALWYKRVIAAHSLDVEA